MSFCSTTWALVCGTLRKRIDEIDLHVSEQRSEMTMSKTEAKIILDHLNGLYERLSIVEAQMPVTITTYGDDFVSNCLVGNSSCNSRVLSLKTKLARVLSETPSTKIIVPESSSKSTSCETKTDTFSFSTWEEVCRSLRERINALGQQVSERRTEMSEEEARIILDHLNGLYERLNIVEAKMPLTTTNMLIKERLEFNKSSDTIVLCLKTNLARIISQAQSSEKNRPTPEPSSKSKLQSLVKKQKFHIEQIESIKIKDVCPVNAQIFYEHVSKLYDRFILNQDEINAQVDDAALADQQTIASRIHGKIIDLQIKLKDIMTPEMSKLDSLVKKSDFLIHQIKSFESKSLVCAKSTKEDFKSIKEDFKYMKNDSQSTKEDLKSMKEYLKSTKEDLKSIKDDSKSTKQDMKTIALKSTNEVLKSVRLGQEDDSSRSASTSSSQPPKSILKTRPLRSLSVPLFVPTAPIVPSCHPDYSGQQRNKQNTTNVVSNFRQQLSIKPPSTQALDYGNGSQSLSSRHSHSQNNVKNGPTLHNR